jgi:hypothetical protein
MGTSVSPWAEAWACLQRARHAGVFSSLDAGASGGGGDKKPLRWASLGGGPGFELLAVKWFFEKYYENYELDLVSLDLEGSWRGAAEGLGQGLTLVHVRAQLKRLQDTFMN